MKIQADEKTIKAIVDTIDTTILGLGILDLHIIQYDIQPMDSYIEINRKDGQTVRPEDTFWLGFHSKDYLDK